MIMLRWGGETERKEEENINIHTYKQNNVPSLPNERVCQVKMLLN